MTAKLRMISVLAVTTGLGAFSAAPAVPAAVAASRPAAQGALRPAALHFYAILPDEARASPVGRASGREAAGEETQDES